MYLLLLLCSDITRRKDGPAHAASFLADIALRTSDYAGAVGRYVVDDQDELEATAVSWPSTSTSCSTPGGQQASAPQASGGHPMRQARSYSGRICEIESVAFSFSTKACWTHLGELVVVVTKLGLDGTAVYAKLVQDLSDLIGDRHVVDIPADHDVNRSNDRSFGQLPDVKLETP